MNRVNSIDENNTSLFESSQKTKPSVSKRNTWQIPRPFSQIELELSPTSPIAFQQLFANQENSTSREEMMSEIIVDLMHQNNWAIAELIALRRTQPHSGSLHTPLLQIQQNVKTTVSNDQFGWNSSQIEVYYSPNWVNTLRSFKVEYDMAKKTINELKKDLHAEQEKNKEFKYLITEITAFTRLLMTRTCPAESVVLMKLNEIQKLYEASIVENRGLKEKIIELENKLQDQTKLTLKTESEVSVLKKKLKVLDDQNDYKEIKLSEISEINFSYKERFNQKNQLLEENATKLQTLESMVSNLTRTVEELELNNESLKAQQKILTSIEIQTDDEFIQGSGYATNNVNDKEPISKASISCKKNFYDQCTQSDLTSQIDSISINLQQEQSNTSESQKIKALQNEIMALKSQRKLYKGEIAELKNERKREENINPILIEKHFDSELKETKAELEKVASELAVYKMSGKLNPNAMEYFKLRDSNEQLKRQLAEFQRAV